MIKFGQAASLGLRAIDNRLPHDLRRKWTKANFVCSLSILFCGKRSFRRPAERSALQNNWKKSRYGIDRSEIETERDCESHKHLTSFSGFNCD